VLRRRKPLQVGFLPVNDCAPLAVAHELGLFAKYGVAVELRREHSWKTIHDKIIHLNLDAAHVPGMLPFLINLGLTPEKKPCVAGLVLSLQGNAITLSRELWLRGVRDAASLREQLFAERGKRTYSFGVALPYSSQYFLLRQWLKSGGIDLHGPVRIVMAPPEELFPLLKLGYLDGYCAGEPWTSVAVQAGVGVCVGTSASLAPLHPEKVLMVREDFAEKHAEEHERLIAALLEACAFCDQPENRPRLCELLARREYVNAPVSCLQPGLVGPFAGEGSPVYSLRGLNIFHAYRANVPTSARAAWITGQLHDYFQWRVRPEGINDVFRSDIFHRAQKMVTSDSKSEILGRSLLKIACARQGSGG
jgi:ABC-type nitrate/sulfonate/bicarbonate transport system substrate-binding protein